jgi:general stress protein YciG
MTKSQAGQLGGLSTFKKHGKKHMQTIGRRGAKKTWTLYSLKPVGQSQYAMVNKQTNEIKAILNSDNFQWKM